MRGSTRKRGTTWTAYWDVPADPVTGKRRQASKGGFRTQKEAQRHLASVVVAVGEGTYIEPSKQPLATFLTDEWLPAISATVRPLTLRRYKQITNSYIRPRDVGGVPLRNLNAGHLNALYADLERAALSISSRRLVHAVLHRALRDAVRWGKIARNVAGSADPPAVPRTRVQAWTAGELCRFLGEVGEDRLAALWRLGATTGMRRGELLGLPWQLLDLDGGRLRVEQPAAGSGRRLRGVRGAPRLLARATKVAPGRAVTKVAPGERSIALDPETVEALRRHRATQLLERDLAGPAYQDHDLVFCDELGRPIYPESLSGWFVRHRNAAGVQSGSLHVLRHTAATLMLTSGIPLHVVAARLGDDPKTVLENYAHLLPRSDEHAAVVVASIVDKRLTNGEATSTGKPDMQEILR